MEELQIKPQRHNLFSKNDDLTIPSSNVFWYLKVRDFYYVIRISVPAITILVVSFLHIASEGTFRYYMEVARFGKREIWAP